MWIPTIPLFAALSCAGAPAEPAERAADLEGFTARSLDVLRQGDRDAWIALQLTRHEYETRCAELVRKNSPGWLDEKMARRAEGDDDAIERCAKLASSEPLKVLWTRGGQVTGAIRIPECTGYEPRDPLRLIVEKADGGRFSVRLDLMRDERAGTMIPTGYAECHRADETRYACARLQGLTDSAERVSSYTCSITLEAEPAQERAEAIACLEAAESLEAANACWGDRTRQ